MSLSIQKKRRNLDVILKMNLFPNEAGDLFTGLKVNSPPLWTLYHNIQKEAEQEGIAMTVGHLQGGGNPQVFNITIETAINAEQIKKLAHIANTKYQEFDHMHTIRTLPARPHSRKPHDWQTLPGIVSRPSGHDNGRK